MYFENGVIKNSSDINEEFFGFYLAPTFNSAKRMNGDMVRTFSVFFGNNQFDDAKYLFDLNAQRKVLVDTEYNRLMTSTQPYAPYIYIANVQAGILGLLAMKIHSATGEPAFVLNDRGSSCKEDRFSGSGRSPSWFNCRESVGDFVFIAGHESAFGCSVKNQTDLERMYRILKTDVPAKYDEAMAEGLLVEAKPDYVISTDWTQDVGIDTDVFYNYVDEKDSFRPFGNGFPAPQGLLIFTNDDVDEWKTMGRAKEHLKLIFSNGFSVICWRQGHLVSKKDVPGTYKILGDLSTSEFRGEISVNFIGTFLESD
jgi:single-stranded-DNA-specific exonuclease